MPPDLPIATSEAVVSVRLLRKLMILTDLIPSDLRRMEW
ncbi:hypothetical protein B8V81_1937 [Paenibacillus pasadenensis]|uniref:Uncharacterized protein n=1 Tax=Paenibacillus pasadenensis TaxID=217090 RepID=A0A2N5NBL1_9BACL|nr:hypothetical protein B8V81_1937 [Paenibacillus pasadenensis]